MDSEKFTTIFWSAVGGAILLAVIGFNWGGWVTGGAASAAAEEMAENAVAKRLGAICVAQFHRDGVKDQKFQEMKVKDSWERARYIEKQPWAIMPGEDKVDRKVADVCAQLIAAKAD